MYVCICIDNNKYSAGGCRDIPPAAGESAAESAARAAASDGGNSTPPRYSVYLLYQYESTNTDTPVARRQAAGTLTAAFLEEIHASNSQVPTLLALLVPKYKY